MSHTIWPIAPLLGDAGPPAVAAAGWPRRAAQIRRRFSQTLGPRPASQRLHEYRVVRERVVNRGVARTLLAIQVDEDDTMEAWLMEPASPSAAGRARVALALHQSTDDGKDEPAGLAGSPDYAYGHELAQRGWTVLAPDHFAVSRRYARGLKAFDTQRLYRRFPGWSAVGKGVADLQIALDVLERLPQTAGQPVSVLGHSLGGHLTLFLAAIDERPAQLACSCGLYPFADSAQRGKWFRSEWYVYFQHAGLKTSVLEGPRPLWDFHEIAALAAPRRLWLAMAPNDYLVDSPWGVHQVSEQLHRLYARLDAPRRLTCLLHNETHSFSPWNRQFLYHWLEADPHWEP